MTFTLMDPREIKTDLAACVLYSLSLVISIKFLFSRLEILINELYRIASLVFFCWMKFWLQLFSFINKKIHKFIYKSLRLPLALKTVSWNRSRSFAVRPTVDGDRTAVITSRAYLIEIFILNDAVYDNRRNAFNILSPNCKILFHSNRESPKTRTVLGTNVTQFRKKP